MRGIRESITRRTEDHLGEQPPHPATIAVLYLLCILLIWFLPGFLAPELFGGGNTYPFIIFEYGGVYLLAAVLFGCSAALLFALMRRKAGSGVRLLALAVALVLLYLVPAYLGGSMQMILPFYVPGWDYFGLSPAVDVLMSAVISFSGIGLLSLATIVPILLIDRYAPMKRPYAAAAVLGTLLFPCLATAIFTVDPVPSLIPWLSLSLSTLSVLCLGVAGAAVLSIPLVVRHLLKGSGNPPQQARVFGLLLLCLLLVWFAPGYLEPGLFLMGHDYPDPGLKMKWFIPYGPGGSESSRFTVPTIEGNYLIDEERFMIRPPASPLSGTALRAVYIREHTDEQYVVDQWWYNNQGTFRDEKRILFESLAGIGEVSETTLDLGDHLLAAGFERSDAEREYPAWLFVGKTTRGYILTYERPFDDGRSNDFFIVYYGTYGNTVGPDPDRSLKALIAQRLTPSAIRAPGEGLDEEVRPSRMPEAKPFLYISEMIRYAGILLLMPLLFGCSAALLFAGALTELETQKRRLAVAIPLLAAVLLFLSLISAYLTGSTWMPIPPFYLPTSEPLGVSVLLDALLNLMVFLSALTLIGLGVIAPYLLLRRHLPLKRPFRAVLVSGSLTFGILIYPLMMMHAVWHGLRPAPWISPLVWMALGFCLAAAWAVVIYAVQAAAGRGAESP
ncbi:hypothetical protein [Methanoculleus chikugoensis]|uniref:Uncharacterized protein n=1 Tax=Methanoculleus chikugoensis TaxID=118126 RepID=A0ABN5XK53_9EURY|nr:hypothetical protein [Methanoculleus chikugoensis]BBL69119.1 hypothetical protein MchiMG62_23000 [Methanoculleus chikugoensis]